MLQIILFYLEEPPLHEPNWSEVAFHRSENLPIIDEQELPLHFYPEDKVITVYTENQHVKSTLNSKHFRLIEPLSETGMDELLNFVWMTIKSDIQGRI